MVNYLKTQKLQTTEFPDSEIHGWSILKTSFSHEYLHFIRSWFRPHNIIFSSF